MSRLSALRLALLLVWAAGALGVPWLARDLDFSIGGWPFHLWWAAQGCVIFFVVVCLVAVWLLGRYDDLDEARHGGD